MTDLPWFKMHTDLIEDERVCMMAVSDRWYFVALLCLKGKGFLEKYEGKELFKRAAFKLGIAQYELEEIAERFSADGLIDRETLQPINWNKRQGSAQTSAERVRRFRERKKAEAIEIIGDVTNVTQNVTLERDLDLDLEIETGRKKEVEAPPVGVAPPSKRGTRLPPDFCPKDSDMEIGINAGLDVSQITDQIERFRDHWLSSPGQRGVKLDWNATFRNWIRRSADDHSRRNPRNRAPHRSDVMHSLDAIRKFLDGRSQEAGQPDGNLGNQNFGF